MRSDVRTAINALLIQGPGRDHILARRDRFDKETIRDIDIQNPYNNINDYITIEEKFGARSTFFFRTNYENGKLVDYEHDIQTLLRGGWEIGLHCGQASVENFDSMYEEKKKLESITKKTVKANRSHYLAFSERLPIILNELGFNYDSSVVESRNRISNNTRGYFLLKKVIEFPITIMDVYLFTYMHISEDKIINTFMYALDCARKYNKLFNIITIVWHANVLKMKGGRKYKDILEYLSCQEDVMLVNGIELAKIVVVSYIHPSTIINDEFEMGENCFIFENNVIQPFVKLEDDVIIWTGNVISHHTTIMRHCFIVSHTAIAGNTTIEPVS